MNAALRALGRDGDFLYYAVDVAPGGLSAAVAGLRALGFAGANVTVPHKVAVLELCDVVAVAAAAAGSVNVLSVDGDQIVGESTDGEGLLRALRDLGISPAGMRVVVLGAGGAARAAVGALRAAGVAGLVCAARRPAQAEAVLALDAPEAGVTRMPAPGASRGAGDAVRLTPGGDRGAGDAVSLTLGGDERALLEALSTTHLVVQATSVGLEDERASPLSDAALAALPAGAAVLDMVYRRGETALVRQARARGLRAADGRGMLVHQAALALERWTGMTAPLEIMHAAAAD